MGASFKRKKKKKKGKNAKHVENNLNPNLYVVIYNFIKPSIGKCSDVSNGIKFIHALSFHP